MVMDAGSKQSILAELQVASHRIAAKSRDQANDILSLVVAEIWEQTDAPAEVIQYLTQKMESLAMNASQRERRARRRSIKCEQPRQSQQARSPRDVIDPADLTRVREVANESCTDQLDQDLVLVLMEEHPEFESPLQVFQHYGTSRSMGYRRLAILKEKLRVQYSALDLSN